MQGPKHVVGRDFVYIAATPEGRRLFLSTAKHLILQVNLRSPCCALLSWFVGAA